jgi:hypothetical protein
MKLVKIACDRCNEYEKTIYYMAPGSMSDGDIELAVIEASQAYLDAYNKAKLDHPKPAYLQTHIDKFDNALTIGEAKALVVENQRQINEANALVSAVAGSFASHLKHFGIIRLESYEGENVVETSVYWGHKHGEKLDY